MVRAVSLALGLALLVSLLIRPSAANIPSADLPIYADALVTGWENYSWDTTVNFSATPAQSGDFALSADFDEPWAGLSLFSTTPLQTASYEALAFWIYGAPGGTSVEVSLQLGKDIGPLFILDAPGATWTEVVIPMATLNLGPTFDRINWQERLGVDQAPFLIDNLRLVGPDTGDPTLLTVDVDLDGAATSFEPDLILGSNLAAWAGPAVTNNATFLARTRAHGNGLVRIPGGSWAHDYGALSCELGQNIANATPCHGNWVLRPTDFINMLRATEREALYIINMNATSKETIATWAFFEGDPADTRVIGVDQRGVDWGTVGQWAQLRADHGNPAPFEIRYWDFGNEPYGATQAAGGASCQPWGWENAWTCEGAEYVNGIGSGAERREGFLEVRAALKAFDPSVLVGVIGLTDPAAYGNWTNEVLAAAGTEIDFLAIHPYTFDDLPPNTPAGWASILNQPQLQWTAAKASLTAAFDQHLGAQRPIIVTEYNLTAAWPYDTEQLMTRAGNGLFIADTIGQMIAHGFHGATIWLLNGSTQTNGTDYGLIRTDMNMARPPQYYALAMWERFGSELLPHTQSLDAATQVSVYAGRRDAATISILAINKSPETVNATFALQAQGTPANVSSGAAYELVATGPEATTVTYNGLADPPTDLDTVAPLPVAAPGAQTSYVLPPYSVVLLHLTLGEAPSYEAFVPLVVR